MAVRAALIARPRREASCGDREAGEVEVGRRWHGGLPAIVMCHSCLPVQLSRAPSRRPGRSVLGCWRDSPGTFSLRSDGLAAAERYGSAARTAPAVEWCQRKGCRRRIRPPSANPFGHLSRVPHWRHGGAIAVCLPLIEVASEGTDLDGGGRLGLRGFVRPVSIRGLPAPFGAAR